MESNKTFYNLTESQKILLWVEWFTLNKKKAMNANVMSFYFTVNENPDCEALKKAFYLLIQNNSSFRIATVRNGIGAKQYILDELKPRIEIEQLNNEADFQKFLKTIDDVLLPFIGENHIWAKIVTYEGKASLVMRVHHLCMDGYSLKLIFERLSEYYESFSSGNEYEKRICPPIEEYFESEKKYAGSNEFKKDRKFWIKQFFHQRKYCIPVKKASLSGATNQHNIVFSPEFYSEIDNFCKKNSMSFVQVIMAASSLVVYKLTKKENFCLSTLTHGRRTESLRNTIGCMMNVYPVFYDVDKNISISEYIKRSSKQYFNSMLHCRFPQMMLVPISYYEAVKNGFRFNHFWILFSSMDFEGVVKKSKYGFSLISLNSIAYQFYCSIFSYDNYGEIKLNYQKKFYTPQQIETVERELRSILKLIMEQPDLLISELNAKIR